MPTTSKFCWKCVQIHLIKLRIQYGTLKLHSLADFEKNLKKSARFRFWGGVKKKSHMVSLKCGFTRGRRGSEFWARP